MFRRRRRECCDCCTCREAHQITRDGQFCQSLRVRECSRGCGRDCGCGCSGSSDTVQTICRCARFIDVPMKTVLGPGFSEVDCCITQNEILQEIADTLRSCRRCC